MTIESSQKVLDSNAIVDNPSIRSSTRIKHPPHLIVDNPEFSTTAASSKVSTSHSLSIYLSYTKLAPAHRIFTATLSSQL